MGKELDRLCRHIPNLSDFIQLGFKILRNNQNLEARAGHFLIVLESCIEEFESLCSLYEELTGHEHVLWMKHGVEFSQEWYELNQVFNPEDDE